MAAGLAAIASGASSLFQFGLNQWNKYQDWDREDNAVQRRVADLEKAGLHPALAAGSAAQASPQSANMKVDPMEMAERADAMKTAQKSREVMDAGIDKTRAETANLEEEGKELVRFNNAESSEAFRAAGFSTRAANSLYEFKQKLHDYGINVDMGSRQGDQLNSILQWVKFASQSNSGSIFHNSMENMKGLGKQMVREFVGNLPLPSAVKQAMLGLLGNLD